MHQKQHCVYMMANKRNTTIYTGVTSNLSRRIYEHRVKAVKGFTAKYNLNKLVYYEVCETSEQAIAREKQIKAGSRKKKEELICRINLDWKDLTGQL